MKTCSEECAKHPCCDFCVEAIQSMIEVNGKMVTGGPIGCKLHKDEEHQRIARSCGYCDDFECFNYRESQAAKS